VAETIFITGGAGFIGTNFSRYIFKKTSLRMVIIDKLTYAGHKASLAGIFKNPRVRFEKTDIADTKRIRKLYQKYKPTYVVNLAAESHVDRSIDHPGEFIETNIVGTHVMLEQGLQFYKVLTKAKQKKFRFLHVSTDEVYGSLGKTGLFKETTAYSPNSPYSASKAAADHLVRAYYETYGFPAIITNCSNNYGPYQFPEKLIPLVLLNAMEGKAVPIYGDGMNIRDWLYVEDHCAGIFLALKRGKFGEKYNIGGRNECTNLQVVDTLLDELEVCFPAKRNSALMRRGMCCYEELKSFVKDRPGHDRRYAIDASKIRSDLGWTPKHNFKSGIARTVRWYLANLKWCRAVQKDNYHRERLGLK